MPDQSARIALRNLLAKLFAGQEDINRIVDDAGLDRTRLVLTASPINTWHNILREAENQGTAAMKRLLHTARNEVPDKVELQQAIAAYLPGMSVDAILSTQPASNTTKRAAAVEAVDATQPLAQGSTTRALPLIHADRTRLVDELQQLPAWADGGMSGEKSVLRAAGLPGRFVNELRLVGYPSTDAINVIAQLESLGHLDDRRTHLALGALVEHLLDQTVHVEGKLFLAYLLQQYRLVTDLAYLDQLRQRYAMLQQLPNDRPVDLGWQLEQPSFSWHGPTDARQLEAVWNKRVPLLDTIFLEQGSRAARAVCRVEFSQEEAEGTGFLVAPNLVLTNHHVLPTDEEAGRAQVRFGYRLDANGKVQAGETYRINRVLKRSPTEALDFVLLELADAPGAEPTIGYLKLQSSQLQTDTSAFIIQHPMGAPQKIVLQDNWIVYVAPDHQRVQYLTNTRRGSSGSPVFNTQWEVIALHHSGTPIPAAAAPVEGNEGIPMRTILPEIRSFLS